MGVANKLMLGALLGLTTLALASPTGASTAHVSGHACQRYRSRGDNDARALARRAELLAELLATEHRGSYASVSPKSLHSLERSLPISPSQARHRREHAYLRLASGTKSSYAVQTRSLNGDTYEIRSSSGWIQRRALACGSSRSW
jgi:hypothetical protein